MAGAIVPVRDRVVGKGERNNSQDFAAPGPCRCRLEGPGTPAEYMKEPLVYGRPEKDYISDRMDQGENEKKNSA